MAAKPRSETICNIVFNYKCGKCKRQVKNGVLCDGCDVWYHFKKCSNILETTTLENEWYCPTCCEAKENGVLDELQEGEYNIRTCFQEEKGLVSKLQEEIDSLRVIVSLLQKDLRELLNSYRQVTSEKDEAHSQESWATVVAGRKKCLNQNLTLQTNIKNQNLTLQTENKFAVLYNEDREASDFKTKKQHVQNQKVLETRRKRKVLSNNYKQINIISDSHGRDLAVRLSNTLPADVKCFGMVKSNSRISECVKEVESLKNEMTKKDLTVIFSGANDVYKNESVKVKQTLKQVLPKLMNTNVVVCGIPTRHDLIPESIVNSEIKKTNTNTAKLCKVFNCFFFDTASLPRECFTKHGLHLNTTGKDRVAQELYKYYLNVNEHKSNQLPPIALGYQDLDTKN